MNACQITRLAARERPRLQLFCLPFAGGNDGFYRGWRDYLPPDIDLNLISLTQKSTLLGRREQAGPRTLPEIAHRLANVMAPDLSLPWVLFGHSMGAVLALELVLQLARRQSLLPSLLAVSAHVAPQFHNPDPLYLLSDDEMCGLLREMGGTSQAMLASPGIRKMILQAVRQDLRLLTDWRPPAQQALPCPIAAFLGEKDNMAPLPAMQGWRSWTRAEFSCDIFPGGHFYFSHDPQPLIVRLLARIPPSPT
ncbi:MULTISPECIES: thioesterase II family protein [Lonsdalea]|uniref:Uncharacterized protein n=2 Tax=Lonsdalea TaxID=1082702 RepID=A0ACD1JD19_9GAMM|nr:MULTISPECIES: alpha/beta fold hydrolase [Lonsdalea]RAT13525.1 hypothetical protein AU485_08590 [Lonsdalea quercina]RAT14611.1 hypothetical protein AU486_12460 [Lonsdalea quercina]RAT20783.1 hypothetical protein AU489_15685 [Lonsdalea populi]RAT21844.1 hypothetical protein AU487_05160 [Lonsdalea populi]RAT22084.1 hypothetical protein AU488_11690 [Lonsdalea populi]